MTEPQTPDQSIEGRDARGRFQPGRSGNPAGKKPGTLNYATRLKERLAGEEFETVAAHLVGAACEGHFPAVRFLMERLVPKGRGRPIALDLPAGASRAARAAAIVDAMCAGEISPDEAKLMLTVIATAAAIPHETAGEIAASPPARTPAATMRAPAPTVDPRGATKPSADLHSTCISPRTDTAAAQPPRPVARERGAAMAA